MFVKYKLKIRKTIIIIWVNQKSNKYIVYFNNYYAFKLYP